jgi:hypothetical protein
MLEFVGLPGDFVLIVHRIGLVDFLFLGSLACPSTSLGTLDSLKLLGG